MDLVAYVKQYALDHYEDGGWDVIAECWADEEIKREIGRARTERGALAKMRFAVGYYEEQQADARNSAF